MSAPWFQARSLIENTRVLSDVFQEIVDLTLADSRASLVLCVSRGGGAAVAGGGVEIAAPPLRICLLCCFPCVLYI